jgi:hypothetical protein
LTIMCDIQNSLDNSTKAQSLVYNYFECITKTIYNPLKKRKLEERLLKQSRVQVLSATVKVSFKL